jgi:HEAT repeat protein
MIVPIVLMLLAAAMPQVERARFLDELQDRRPERRMEAMRQLGGLGQIDGELIGRLIDGLRDSDPLAARAAHDALVALAPSDLPGLIDSYDCLREYWSRPDDEPICPVRDVLVAIGPSVAPAVCSMLHGPPRESELAAEIAEQLGLIACVPQLIEALAGREHQAASIALAVLAKGDPRLVAALDRPEPLVRLGVVHALLDRPDGRQVPPEILARAGRALADALKSAPPEDQPGLVIMLAALGEHAAPAAGSLLEIVETAPPSTLAGEEAARALWRAGGAGTAAVLAAWPRLDASARALLLGAGSGPQIAGLLAGSAHDPDPQLRRAAVRRLGAVPTNDPAMLLVLRDAAENDTDPTVRAQALRSLGGAQAASLPELCPFLLRAARDESGDPMLAALEALERACHSAPGTRSPLVEFARSAPLPLRRSALEQLTRQRPLSSDLPGLIESALREPELRGSALAAIEMAATAFDLRSLLPVLLSTPFDGFTLAQAAASIRGVVPALAGAVRRGGQPGEVARRALYLVRDLEALVPLLRDPNPAIRTAARAGFHNANEPNQYRFMEDDTLVPLVERLSKALAPGLVDPDPDLRAWAAGEIVRLPQPSWRVVELLFPLLGDEDQSVRTAAKEALASYDDPATWPLFIDSCRTSCRVAGAELLAALDSPAAVELLERLARDTAEEVRSGVAQALGRARPVHRGLFLTLLRDRALVVRRAVVRSMAQAAELSGLDEAERRELAGLVAPQLGDEDELERRWAVGAIARLGEAAEAALQDALKDPHLAVAAREALMLLPLTKDE